MEPGAAGRRWQRQSQGGVGARTLSPPSTPEPGRIRRGSLALPPRARAPSRRLARRLEAGAAGSGAAQGPARGRAAARTQQHILHWEPKQLITSPGSGERESWAGFPSLSLGPERSPIPHLTQDNNLLSLLESATIKQSY
ncbi:unnamed protein product [Lepidochelys olivacea]